MKAIFFDRDGTLIEHSKTTKYTVLPEHIVIKPDLASLAPLQDEYLFFIITNAGGIGRREHYQPEDFHAGLQILITQAEKLGIKFEKTYYSFYHPKTERYPEHEYLRKPNTGMIEQALVDYPTLELDKSWVVGDSNVDIEIAHKMKIQSIFLAGANTSEKYLDLSGFPPTHTADSLSQAVEFISMESELRSKS